MSADEMLKTLGYRFIKHHEDKLTVLLYKHERTRYEIGFNTDDFSVYFGNKEITRNYIPLSLEELFAVVKKCQELGWIE